MSPAEAVQSDGKGKVVINRSLFNERLKIMLNDALFDMGSFGRSQQL